MRDGRKSKRRRFNGYKQHFGTDLDSEFVVACASTPANRPEEEATEHLQEDMARQQLFPDEMLIDRAYINSDLAEDVQASGGRSSAVLGEALARSPDSSGCGTST